MRGMDMEGIRDEIYRTGLKAHLESRFGFETGSVSLLESSGRDGDEYAVVTFEVNGLGWTWDAETDDVVRSPAHDADMRR